MQPKPSRAFVSWARTEEREAFLRRLRERKAARSHKHLPSWMVRAKGWMPDATAIKGNWMGRLLGKSVMRPECWSFKPHNAALGLALGMFVAWTPTIGAQMAFSAFLCCLFGGNVPLGVVGVWFSNPVFYAAEVYVGFGVMGLEWPVFNKEAGLMGIVTMALKEGFMPMCVGSVVLGLPAAAMTYFSAYGFAHWQRRHHLLRTLRERNAMRRDRWKMHVEERRAARAENRVRRHARKAARKTAKAAASSTVIRCVSSEPPPEPVSGQ